MVSAFAGVFVLGEGRLEFLGPDRFAVLAIEAEQMAFEVVHFAGDLGVHAVTGVAGHEHTLADDDWAGTSRPRQFGFPDEVLRIAPVLSSNAIRISLLG